LKCNRLKPLPFKGLKSDNLGSVECQQCSDVSAKCTGVVAGDFSDAAIDRQNCVESDTSQLLTFSQNDIVECRTLSSVNLDSGMHALATIGLVGSNSRGVHTLTSRANCWRNRFHLLLPPVGEQSIAISLSLCPFVREHISGTAGPIFTKCFTQIPCGRGSVLLWQRGDMLCTSGIMDDVTCRSGPYGDAWEAEPLTYCH